MSCLSMSIKFWTLKLSWLHSKLVGEWIFLWASKNLNPLAHMASAFFQFGQACIYSTDFHQNFLEYKNKTPRY